MDDPLVVRRSQGVRDLPRDRERVVDRQPAALQALGKILPLDEFQHQEQGVTRVLEPVDRRDVRVIEGGQHLRFPPETGETLRVLRDGGREHLDGHLAPELRVVRAVDLTHATGADGFGEAVLAQDGARIHSHDSGHGSRGGEIHHSAARPLRYGTSPPALNTPGAGRAGGLGRPDLTPK